MRIGRCASYFRLLSWALAAVVTFGSLATPSALGQDEDVDARARRYFEAGSEQYDAGDFEGALASFRRAYATSGRTALLYNVGQAAERAEQLSVAIDAYNQYLDAEPNGPRSDEVRRNLTLLEAEADASQPAGAGAPTPEQTAQAALAAERPLEPEPEETSIVESPVLWVVLGAVVIGGILTAFLLSQKDEAPDPNQYADADPTFTTQALSAGAL